MVDFKGFISLIGFIMDYSDFNIFWQFVNKIRLDVLWIGGFCGGVIDYKQYVIGLVDFFLCVFNINFFYCIRSVLQFCSIDDVQWYFINMDMFMQNIMGGTGNVGNDGRFFI